MFAIEKNVPLASRRRNDAKYPFRDMRIGDSFFVPHTDIRAIPRVRSAASEWARRMGWEFTTRKVEGGLRIWRKV